MFRVNTGKTVTLKCKTITKSWSVGLLFTCMQVYWFGICLFVFFQAPPCCWLVHWSEAGLVAQRWTGIELLGNFFVASVFFKKETFFVSFWNESLSTTAAGVEFNLSWSKLLNFQRVCGRGGGLNHIFPWTSIFVKKFSFRFSERATFLWGNLLCIWVLRWKGIVLMEIWPNKCYY